MVSQTCKISFPIIIVVIPHDGSLPAAITHYHFPISTITNYYQQISLHFNKLHLIFIRDYSNFLALQCMASCGIAIF
jgi:hypothetical protein